MILAIKTIKNLTFLMITICFLCTYIYIVSYHHINLQDFNEIIKTMNSEQISSRCRKYLDSITNNHYFRCLPNVLLIGASKCGTTSLVQYLTSLDMIRLVNRRIHPIDNHHEVHRFDRQTYRYSLKTLELADEWTSSPMLLKHQNVLIHYTPHYLYAPSVPYDVEAFYPHAPELKFIVMLRDPLERAWSSYWFHNSHLLLRGGVDKGSALEFMNLAKEEISRRKKFELCMIRCLLSNSDKSVLKGVSIERNTNDLINEENYKYDDIINNDTQITLFYIKLLMRYNNILPSPTSTAIPGADKVATSSNQKLKPIFQSYWQRCFGLEYNLKSLGKRHIDKGVYFDQIIRWYHNFKRNQFHFILLEEFNKQPRDLFHSLLLFLDQNNSNNDLTKVSISNSSAYYYERHLNHINFTTQRRLVKPNSLQPNIQSSLSVADFELLSNFYKPYNQVLYKLLKK